MKDGEERVIKKRRKKQEGGILEEKKPRKNKVPKPGWAFNFSSVVSSEICCFSDIFHV